MEHKNIVYKPPGVSKDWKSEYFTITHANEGVLYYLDESRRPCSTHAMNLSYRHKLPKATLKSMLQHVRSEYPEGHVRILVFNTEEEMQAAHTSSDYSLVDFNADGKLIEIYSHTSAPSDKRTFTGQLHDCVTALIQKQMRL